MARAVLIDRAAGRPATDRPPAASRVARWIGVRTESVRFLWDGEYRRVGTRALAKIAGKMGCRLATFHGEPVVLPVEDCPLPDLEGAGSPVPISPEEAMRRVQARLAQKGAM
ncbi:MAG: hypothetical protein AAFY12_12300 [Pseudomonadota bacterium]